MARTIMGVIAGAVTMWLLVSALEFIGHALYPPPPGLDPTNPDALATIIASAPTGSLLMLLLAWVVGAFGGGLVAAWIARAWPRTAAVCIGVLVMLGVVAMIWLVPQHPRWLAVSGLLLPIPAALLAAAIARRANANHTTTAPQR